MIRYLIMLIAAIVLVHPSCSAPQQPIPGGQAPEAWQVHAAARNGLTTMELNGISLHDAGTLRGEEWRAYASACESARVLLVATGASVDPQSIAQAAAIIAAAVRTGQAAALLAHPEAITHEAAAEYEAAGADADAKFEDYLEAHPD